MSEKFAKIYTYYTGQKPPRLATNVVDAEVNRVFLESAHKSSKVYVPHQRLASIIGVYGQGEYGMVFKVLCEDRETVYAVKIAKATVTFQKALPTIHLLAAKYHAAPKLFALYESTLTATDIFPIKTGKYFITVMDPISGVLSDVLRKPISNAELNELFQAFECLLGKKYLLELVHGDMHYGNVAVLGDEKTLGFIDFDLSTTDFVKEFNFLDVIPLVTSLSQWGNSNGKKVAKWLLDYTYTTFNVKMVNKSFIRRKGGGYQYTTPAGTLHSYLTISPFSSKTIRAVFPSFKLPTVE